MGAFCYFSLVFNPRQICAKDVHLITESGWAINKSDFLLSTILP